MDFSYTRVSHRRPTELELQILGQVQGKVNSLKTFIVKSHWWRRLNSIWPLEASRTFTNAHFDGFDISPAQYPPGTWLPNNVALHVHDAYVQFPPTMLATFDVIHIQKLITIIYDNNPVPLIQNVMKLLSTSSIVFAHRNCCLLRAYRQQNLEGIYNGTRLIRHQHQWSD